MPDLLARERTYDIPADDGKKIFLIRNAAGDAPSPRAVILAHGLTGNPSEHLHMVARDVLNAQGYDVYRMAFYWDGPDYRSLKDCTLALHAADLNRVVAHVRETHDKVFVCGHSYGGLTTLIANPDADAVSFWDASYKPWQEFVREAAKPVPELDCYALDWNCYYLISKAFVEEAESLDAKAPALAKAFRPPAQVVMAQANRDNASALYDDLACEKHKTEIEADHCFIQADTAFTLAQKTAAWFDKF